MHFQKIGRVKRHSTHLGLALWRNFIISSSATSTEYEVSMGDAFAACGDREIGTAGFGDLFLAEIPAYRDRAFVCDGPSFHEPMCSAVGDMECRHGFWFCDLVS